MRAMIVGDSHTGVLNQARLRMEREGRLPDDIALNIRPLAGGPTLARPFFEEIDGVAVMTEPGIKARMPRLPPAGARYDVIGLSGPLHPVRVWRNRHWQDYRIQPSGGHIPVSQALFRRVVFDDQGPMLRLIELLQAQDIGVLVVEPPRPFRHHPSVEALGADLVIDLDRRYRGLVRAWLTAHGVVTVDVPDACLDGDGFMKPVYRSDVPTDPHHGNADFGELMVARALAAVAEMRGVAGGAAQPGEGRVNVQTPKSKLPLANSTASNYVAGQ